MSLKGPLNASLIGRLIRPILTWALVVQAELALAELVRVAQAESTALVAQLVAPEGLARPVVAQRMQGAQAEQAVQVLMAMAAVGVAVKPVEVMVLPRRISSVSLSLVSRFDVSDAKGLLRNGGVAVASHVISRAEQQHRRRPLF